MTEQLQVSRVEKHKVPTGVGSNFPKDLNVENEEVCREQ